MSSYTFISICNGGNVIHISPYGAKNCTKEEDFLKSPFSYEEDEYVCVCFKRVSEFGENRAQSNI